MARKLNAETIAHVKRWEAFRAESYPDSRLIQWPAGGQRLRSDPPQWSAHPSRRDDHRG